MLRSLEQDRANYAWKCIQEVKKLNNEDIEKKYNSYVKKAPTLIQTNGLGNTLAFYKSKFGRGSEEKHKSKFGRGSEEKLSSERCAYNILYDNLNEWFNRQKKNNQDILKWIISENTSSIEIFQIAKEILALLSWMKRFAEAELKEGVEGG